MTTDILQRTALGALAQFYNSAEFYSAITPPALVSVSDLQSSGPPNPLVQWLKPTLILSGPAGRTVIAPYGEADGSGATGAIGAIGLIFGLGFVAGALFSRR